jgi:hypothetical protein
LDQGQSRSDSAGAGLRVSVHLPPASRPTNPLSQRVPRWQAVVLRLHGDFSVQAKMKRTPLIRHTPLRPGKPWRTWRRPEEDKVTPDLAAYIFNRDGICLQARYEPEHRCRTRFGDEHAPDDRRYLRIAHVKADARAGKRAEPQKDRLVAECDLANERWSSSHRDIERAYLAEKEPG